MGRDIPYRWLAVKWEEGLAFSDSISVSKYVQKIPKIDDSPWPGFPADLTSIITVVATQCSGAVLIFEKMFESRLFWVDMLGESKMIRGFKSYPDFIAGASTEEPPDAQLCDDVSSKKKDDLQAVMQAIKKHEFDWPLVELQ